jgi:nucleotide-binding universal stress UspA family protein
MYDRILVPTDGTDTSEVAVEQGVTIASAFDATVHFLYVVDEQTEMAASASGQIADDLTETFEAEAADALEAAEDRAGEAGVAAEREIFEGIPEDAIVDYSAEHEIDLIVVGESDRSGIRDQLLGTTTDHVLESADVSVLVARPTSEPRSRDRSDR